MQLGSMFISNCNNTLHVSDAFCVLYSFFLVLLYWQISFACLATMNSMFGFPCIDLGHLFGYLNPSVCNINVHTLHLPKLLLVFSYNN